MSTTSISTSIENEILNKFISTTPLSTNVTGTESPSKYNTQLLLPDCQTDSTNACTKQN